VDDLDQSFQDIGDELRNQYSIAYLPTNYVLDGRYHKIRIEVPDHKGYQVRARRGYFARANANVPAAQTLPVARADNQLLTTHGRESAAASLFLTGILRKRTASESAWPRPTASHVRPFEYPNPPIFSEVKCVS